MELTPTKEQILAEYGRTRMELQAWLENATTEDLRRKSNGKPSFPARVLRTHSAGSLARVSLKTETGEAVLVELSLEEFNQLALKEGETVFLYPKNARVFIPQEQL